MILTGGDILSHTDNQETREPKSTEPVKFPFKAIPVGINTTVNKIVRILAFHCKTVL